MEDYQEYIEEEYINDVHDNTMYEDEKLNYVLEEMNTFCEKYHLPFLKNNQTYQLFQEATKKIN